MNMRELLEYFKWNVAAASRHIGISRQSVHKWRSMNRIPYTAELVIEKMTNGDLKAGPDTRLKVLDNLGRIEHIKKKIEGSKSRLEKLYKSLELLEKKV